MFKEGLWVVCGGVMEKYKEGLGGVSSPSAAVWDRTMWQSSKCNGVEEGFVLPNVASLDGKK